MLTVVAISNLGEDMLRSLLLVFFLIVLCSQAFAFGEKVKRPKAKDFGNVVINNYSTANGEAAVIFPHWLHRTKYTCRLCHVDLGFAMQAGDTDIIEEDNNSELFCGFCHNGKIAFGPYIDLAEQGKVRLCQRCHSQGQKVQMKNSFSAFRKGMPRERFGNGIDWMTAEDQGKIKLVDYLDGASIKRNKIKEQQDFKIEGAEQKMPQIIFSHQKHAVWNGCGTCHPEIFPVRKGSQPYSMQQIFAGQYCGACHDKVAFPNIDCQRCHTDNVY